MKPVPKSERLKNVHYEIRGPVLAQARQLEAEGHHIIKLNLGNPGAFGFTAPQRIRQDMADHLSEASGYSDSKGFIAVREAIQQMLAGRQITGVTPDDIYVGNGVSELIMVAMQALLNPGDQVLIPAPDYPLWTAAVAFSGGMPVHYLCDEQSGWLPDLEDMRARITPRTRALVIINPNNPTGALYPVSLLRDLVELARTHELIIFADEIYDQLIYDGASHTSVAALSNDVPTVTFCGLSKNYLACGYRAGWMAISGLAGVGRQCMRGYIDGLNVISSMRLCSNVPGQYAILGALKSGNSMAQALVAPGGRLFGQREQAVTQLNAIEGVSCVKPKAAFYLFVRLDPAWYPVKNDTRFVLDLLLQEHVLLVQGSGFNWPRPDHFRLVFLPPVDELHEAITRIARFLGRNRGRVVV